MIVFFWLLLLLVLVFGFVVFFGAPYVPSKKGEVARAFEELYPLGSGDTLVDIGSGDGIILRLAALRGARAVGYELNPLLVLISRWLSRGDKAVTVHCANFWHVSLPPETTVVYTFGDSRDIVRMANKVAEAATELNRPLVFISYAISVPGHTPQRQVGPHFLYRIEPLQGSVA
jgi:hypothetical protein